jgi:hypothetical protein
MERCMEMIRQSHDERYARGTKREKSTKPKRIIRENRINGKEEGKRRGQRGASSLLQGPVRPSTQFIVLST